MLGLLAIVGFLLLSERFHGLDFNEKTGWTVAIALAAVGLALLFTLLCFIAARLFRWHFQFSIRSLLVLIVVVAIPCSWLTTEMKKAREQSEAVEAIAWVMAIYDYDVNKSGDIVGGRPKGPIWLRSLFGDDFFGDVVGVFSFYEVSPNFRSRRIPITDAGLEHVQRLPRLHWMHLTHTQITDGGLVHLKELHQLDDLSLAKTEITDAGLHHLEGLTQLRFLNLTDTKATDEGVKKLQQALPNCTIEWNPPTKDERQSPAKPDQPSD
jgi:hypothetical protein